MKLREEIEVLDHQITFRDFALVSRYVLNGDEMGLGKTLSSLLVMAHALDRLEFRQGLIICPASLKSNWKSEIEKFYSGVTTNVINGAKDLIISPFSDINIVNYERLEVAQEMYSEAVCVIIDEAHYAKNIEAMRTQFIHKLTNLHQPYYLILLTGTPVKNHIPDFYSLLRLLSYGKDTPNGKCMRSHYSTLTAFSKKFAIASTSTISVFSTARRKYVKKKITTYSGLRNEKILRTYFKGKYMRRRTSEVITLPEMKDIYVNVNYTSKDTALWKEYQKFMNGSVEENETLMNLKKRSAMMKAKFTAQVAKTKAEDNDTTVVIFTEHVDSAEEIARILKVPFITGKTSNKKRDKILDDFDKQIIRYYVATIGTSSTGINLTSSYLMIFNDMSYQVDQNRQAKKRTNRIGQTRDCLYLYISGSFIDTKIMENLNSKAEAIDRLLEE